jgi:hypothetical protein
MLTGFTALSQIREPACFYLIIDTFKAGDPLPVYSSVS